MFTLVVCLIVVGVACAAVYRITFGDEDQPATTPKQRHRAQAPDAADAPGVPAPTAGPDSLVPAPDPTALDAGPSDLAPAAGAVAVREPLPAEPTVPVGSPGAKMDAPRTVELRPEPTQQFVPGELLRAEPTLAVPLDAATTNGDGTSTPAAGSDPIVLHLPEPADGADAPVVFPTPGRTELVPGFDATLLPWEPYPSAPSTAPAAPADPPTGPPAAEAPVEPATEVVTTIDATMAVPVTAPPAAGATSTAAVEAPPAPTPGPAPVRTGQSSAAGTAVRSRTVIVAPPSGARRLRSSVALVATMTMVGVLLAAAIGVVIVLAAYGLRTVITG